MQHNPAVRVDRVVDLRARAQRGDDDRHAVFDDDVHVVVEPVVGAVHDLVDCKWRDGRIGMRSRVGPVLFDDAVQPVRQQ